MVNNIIFFWRILHYNIFQLERFFSKGLLFTFNKILKHPNIVSFYSKRGVNDPSKQILHTVNDPRVGTNVIIAGIQMGGILVLLQFSLIFFTLGLLGEDVRDSFFNRVHLYGIFTLIPAAIINYFLLFKGDRYLHDFTEFEKLSPRVLMQYRVFNALFVFLVLVSFFSTLLWAIGES